MKKIFFLTLTILFFSLLLPHFIIDQPAVAATPTPSATEGEVQAIEALINLGNQAVISEDLQVLQSLYLPEAVIYDQNGTPERASDDKSWSGWEQIQTRYFELFANGWHSLYLADPIIQVTGALATLSHDGFIADGEFINDPTQYVLQKIEGQWRIMHVETGLVSLPRQPATLPQCHEPSEAPVGDEATLLNSGFEITEQHVITAGEQLYRAAVYQPVDPQTLAMDQLRITREADGQLLYYNTEFFLRIPQPWQDLNGDGSFELVYEASNGGNCYNDCAWTCIMRLLPEGQLEDLGLARNGNLIDIDGDGLFEVVEYQSLEFFFPSAPTPVRREWR